MGHSSALRSRSDLSPLTPLSSNSLYLCGPETIFPMSSDKNPIKDGFKRIQAVSNPLRLSPLKFTHKGFARTLPISKSLRYWDRSSHTLRPSAYKRFLPLNQVTHSSSRAIIPPAKSNIVKNTMDAVKFIANLFSKIKGAKARIFLAGCKAKEEAEANLVSPYRVEEIA